MTICRSLWPDPMDLILTPLLRRALLALSMMEKVNFNVYKVRLKCNIILTTTA